MMRKVFVSYSRSDARWLKRLLVHLRPLERNRQVEVWDDTRIKPGQNWNNEIAAALTGSNVAVLLVSADFLASEFIATEELPALLRAATQRDCRIFPVIVGSCLFSEIKDLQQFQAINSPRRPLDQMRKAEREACLAMVAKTVLDYLSEDKTAPSAVRGELAADKTNEPNTASNSILTGHALEGKAELERLIRSVDPGSRNSAEQAALHVIAATDSVGHNEVFEALLNYQDCPDHDGFWGALQVAEGCVRLAPWLIEHEELSRMAGHQNRSVRSSAASICMDLAHFAPDRVPLDILLKLSVHDEDWYVEAPANAALKAMARCLPAVLNVYYMRLRSAVAEERAHAAHAIGDIAGNEPGLLDPRLLNETSLHLKRTKDKEAYATIRKALSKTRRVARIERYRYGL